MSSIRSLSTWMCVFIGAACLQACGSDESISPSGVDIPLSGGHELLSEYNFFVGDISDLNPNVEAGVTPYDLNSPLFSDYASKKRFIYVPEGKQAPYKAVGTLDLPVGSVLIKHFYYNADEYIETRLLIRSEAGWKPETYIWNEDLSDARRNVVGGTAELTINVDGQDKSFTYQIPNQNQCKNCHAMNGAIKPIGPKVANLNKDYNYLSGAANQIEHWVATGILTSPSGDVPRWPAPGELNAPLADRAKAYLDSNCSSCHRREGAAANSGLYLEFENEDEFSSGIWKTPVAAGDGSGGLRYVIKPGSAEESILWYRMNSSEVEVRMPELGRELIHTEGVELIRDWINSME